MAQKSTGQKLATCPSNHVSFLRGTPHYPENDTAFFTKISFLIQLMKQVQLNLKMTKTLTNTYKR